MHVHPPNLTAAADDDSPEIGHWRERLLAALLKAGLVVGAVPCLLGIGHAWSHGDFWHVAVASGAMLLLAVLLHQGHRSYRWRAGAALVILYAVGLWLLGRVGVVSLVYLLACPVVAMLLLSARAALLLLLLCTVTVPVAGMTLRPQDSLPGFDGQPLLGWINVALNFGFVGSLVTLSSAFLLRRLEQSLGQQRRASESLRASEELLRQIAAQVPGMVFRLHIAHDGRPSYLYVSPGIRELFGIEPDALLADGSLLRRLWHPDDRARIERELLRARQSNAPLSLEFRVQLPDGSEKWLQVRSGAVSQDERGSVRNGIMSDISERKASEALVWRQANFDALTGLPNRRMQRDRLEQAIARSQRDGQPLALMLVDLDHFKEVNDTLGHDRGDLLLVEAARRIRACVRESDVVARMGGDEFTVILPGLGQPARVEHIAHQMLASLAAPFLLGGEVAYVSASIGITLYPADAALIEDLLKNADQALYAAKDAGRNRFSYFTPELQAQAQTRVRLANDLRRALDEDQLELHYQPIIELASGRVTKAEALLRWHHPERGAVPPDQFIPIAESTGLIAEIGDWVFRRAAAQVCRWRTQVHPQFQVSVNRSPAQFRGDGAGRASWADILEALGLPGSSIAVEITEGLLLDASEAVSAQLLAFRDAGIAVSLDDFGTGYSSLSYLQQLDIDYLKIDRSFVHALGEDGSGRPLCKAMIVMAHELGLKVVAEGVETAEQHDWLRQAGCDYAQGYHFARPMPAEAFEAFLAARMPAAEVVLPAVG